MGKPPAKNKQPLKREKSVKKSQITKKKPRGKRELTERLVRQANVVKSTKAALVDLVRKNGKVPKEIPKPGRYVLAPPQTPSSSSAGDSDSENEEYMDQFFEPNDNVEDIGGSSADSSEESEPSEEDEDDEETEGDGEEEEDEERPGELVNGHGLDSIAEESDSDEYSSCSDEDFQFSPSEVVLDPDIRMDEYDDDSDSFHFNLDDYHEINIDSYSESPSSCTSASDDEEEEESYSSDDYQDEFVEGNGRFLDVDGCDIHFPSNGAAFVELDNDSDECPELVPIPESFKSAPPPPSKATQSKPKTTRKAAVVHPAKEPSLITAQEVPQPAEFEYYLSHDFSEVLVHLKRPFFFHGMLSIRVIAGAIELMHHTRRAAGGESEEILAMATTDDHPVRVAVVPQPSHALTRGLADPALKRFHYSHLMEIKQSFQDSHAVLLLKSINANHLKFVQGHMSKKLLLPEDLRKNLETSLRCKFYNSHPKQFSPIDSALLELPPNSSFPRIITVGGKNTGKSTFNKCLVNSLLSGNASEVLYVDLDIGQPEFGVPQTLSAYLLKAPVIGKGFLKCHTMDPYYSLVYGHCNVALDVIGYAKCVKALFDRLNTDSDLTPIPWVVNTMGYVRGVGLDLMHFILTQLRPTKVLQFDHPHHYLENFPAKLNAEFMRRHEPTVLQNERWSEWEFDWQAVPGFAANRGAEDVRPLKGSEARQMNVLSHLGLAMSNDFATTLNEVAPIW